MVVVPRAKGMERGAACFFCRVRQADNPARSLLPQRTSRPYIISGCASRARAAAAASLAAIPPAVGRRVTKNGLVASDGRIQIPPPVDKPRSQSSCAGRGGGRRPRARLRRATARSCPVQRGCARGESSSAGHGGGEHVRGAGRGR
jgi:hypothetical protein